MKIPPTLQCSLPMYSLPNCEQLWQQFTDELVTVLSQKIELRSNQHITIDTTLSGDLVNYWQSPDLLLSQTCSYPLLKTLRQHVTPIGCWAFIDDANNAGQYASVIICHKQNTKRVLDKVSDSEFANITVAVNSLDSLSGYWQLLRWLDSKCANSNKQATESNCDHTLTGSHTASIAAVASGKTDIASIDNITWRLLQQFSPELCTDIVVLEQTQPAPALPLIIANNQLDYKLDVIAALEQIVSHSKVATALGLSGFIPTTWQTYLDFADELDEISGSSLFNKQS